MCAKKKIWIVMIYYFTDLASAEKNRLEEKQRAARKERKRKKEEWSPVYVSAYCLFHSIIKP
jgi:hypothetical protein